MIRSQRLLRNNRLEKMTMKPDQIYGIADFFNDIRVGHIIKNIKNDDYYDLLSA